MIAKWYDTLHIYDKQVACYAKEDEVCQKLMTIPGVGMLNAVAFKATIETPDRIKRTRSIGHYLGLTPKIYSSGEVERRGRITKCGPTVMRSLLFEAAQCLLRRVKCLSTLKSWGLRLCKRKPKKVVITALARKLAVVMLSVWKKGEPFCPVFPAP